MSTVESSLLVEHSLALLMEVRAELQSRSETSWSPQLDEAIELLQKARRAPPASQALTREALKALTAALAALPAVARLVRWLSKE